MPFIRLARLGAALLLLTTLPAAAVTTPGDHIKVTRVTLSAGEVAAEVNGPRCRTRRAICRRYVTDERTIRCLERFGCFTGPRFE